MKLFGDSKRENMAYMVFFVGSLMLVLKFIDQVYWFANTTLAFGGYLTNRTIEGKKNEPDRGRLPSEITDSKKQGI